MAGLPRLLATPDHHRDESREHRGENHDRERAVTMSSITTIAIRMTVCRVGKLRRRRVLEGMPEFGPK
jgi:hypothetical protein